MKIILFVILITSFYLTANADIYVCLSKTDGSPQGVVDIRPEALPDWAENFIMIPADESYRGKQSYEIKYKNQKLRHATQAEIDDYLNSIKPKTEKEKFLEMLEDKDIKTKIKEIKNLP